MTITYLKKSPKTSSTDDTKTTVTVQDLLKNIQSTKEQGCIDLTKKFDKYNFEANPRWQLDNKASFLKGAGVKL